LKKGSHIEDDFQKFIRNSQIPRLPATSFCELVT
jgi:hypothetical protein